MRGKRLRLLQGFTRQPGCWFYAYLPDYARLSGGILDQVRNQSLSDEVQLWIAELATFRDYVRGVVDCPPADRQHVSVIRAVVDHIEPLILGPLKKPGHGAPADWEAVPGVSWAERNKRHDPRELMVSASCMFRVRGPTGIWRPYGFVEGEKWPPACWEDDAADGAADEGGSDEA